ncbi:hypothetical protein B0A49_01201 [Cryomyces minteri]|uniref:Uncharacterized protein n=1 Tax=Cryomyces minteri TaxID=331657 RepID=A0A4U0XEQ5_9PEZI|nr:hypothetical protein B0A49_01201 [Cryomyces minteri]
MDVLFEKLSALKDRTRHDPSVAAATDYLATTTKKQDTKCKAVAEMMPDERQYYEAFRAKTLEPKLPVITWETDRGRIPKSTRHLKSAQRHAEALNRLYCTDKAEICHATWFAKTPIGFMPLVKAIDRVIGAERDAVGGQTIATAAQLAELQTLRYIISTTARIMDEDDRRTHRRAVNIVLREKVFLDSPLPTVAQAQGRKEREIAAMSETTNLPAVQHDTPPPPFGLMPTLQDSISTLFTKLSALKTTNVAAATDYHACPTHGQPPELQAIRTMPPLERQFYLAYKAGKLIAQRRAEALNRLYETNEARPCHATWLAAQHVAFLPLVKAIARVIGRRGTRIIAVAAQIVQKRRTTEDTRPVNGLLQEFVARRAAMQRAMRPAKRGWEELGDADVRGPAEKRTR